MANGSFLTLNNIVAIILGIIGLIWLIYGIWRNIKINHIRSWPKANALVLNSVAQPANAPAGNTYIDPRYIVATTNSSAQYIPIIIYQYDVNGKQYTSNNVTYSGPKSYNSLDIKTIMGQIYPGSVIPIYYNPRNNAESYIYNGSHSYLEPILGFLLLLISGYLAYHHNYANKTPVSRIGTSPTPVLTTEAAPAPTGITATNPTTFRYKNTFR